MYFHVHEIQFNTLLSCCFFMLTFGLCEGVSERDRLMASVKRSLYKEEKHCGHGNLHRKM